MSVLRCRNCSGELHMRFRQPFIHYALSGIDDEGRPVPGAMLAEDDEYLGTFCSECEREATAEELAAHASTAEHTSASEPASIPR